MPETVTVADGLSSDTSAETVTINGPLGSLFTTNADKVDFNKLSMQQVASVAAKSNLYHSLSGNDVVYLPNAVSAGNLGGTGVAFNYATPFVLGSGKDIIYGSDTPSTIIGGAGTDTIDVGAATDTFSLNSVSLKADFSNTSSGTLVIDSSSEPKSWTGNVTDFVSGDTIDIKGKSLTSYYSGNGSALQLFSGKKLVGTLNFSSGTQVQDIELQADGHGGTDIEFDESSNIQDPVGTKINWSKLHYWESGPSLATYTSPYVSTGLSGMTIGQGVDLGPSGNLLSLRA